MRLRRRQRGAALIEMASILPFSVLLCVGLSDFSTYFWRQLRLEEASRGAVSATALPPEAPALAARIGAETGSQAAEVTVTQHFTCPDANGEDREFTDTATHCDAERTYVRVVVQEPSAPLLTLLKAAGYPAYVRTRHWVRIR